MSYSFKGVPTIKQTIKQSTNNQTNKPYWTKELFEHYFSLDGVVVLINNRI